MSLFERLGPIDRTPGIPGSDKKKRKNENNKTLSQSGQIPPLATKASLPFEKFCKKIAVY